MSTTTDTLPGLTTGTWAIDPVHSEVGFSVRHVMVSKVKGTFRTFEGTITVPEDRSRSTVAATIDISSVDTRDENRDNHLRSDDFFAADTHPQITFESTRVASAGGDYTLEGNLTIRGVTRSVALEVEFNGVSPDPWGGTRAGFSATTEISRKDYGIDFNIPLDGGGVVVGDHIKVSLEVEAVLQPSGAQ